MSVMPSLLLFFLLNVSDYSCNARPFSIMDKEESSRQVQILPSQDMEKAIPLKVKLSISKEVLQKRGQGLVGANTDKKLKDTQALPKGAEERKETISGSVQIDKSLVSVSRNVPHVEHKEHHPPVLNMDYSPSQTRIIQITMHSSDDVGLRETTKIKGSGRRLCSLVGSASPVNKEMVDSKENDDISEDLVVMDYQQPHRKPPIHNASP